ncbi:rano class II histocompatibility antigen, A beta chain-like [Chanos chanos]|uniref:Rano class II histocompatibility antigen, A beta chain-like n=1 Tax=Chanos chanos TaxID=29144 RepID=A0A6J2UN56_CHACN|nr:rano class II histocompatibility antigen, A beta chain-like [Chanos chanos]
MSTLKHNSLIYNPLEMLFCPATCDVLCAQVFGWSIKNLFSPGDGRYGYVLLLCRSTLRDPQEMELIYSINYNKLELLRFNSTLNKVVGYTDFGIKYAEDLNNRTEWLHNQASKALADCRRYGNQFFPYLNVTVKPHVQLRSVKQVRGDHPAMLICSAYDFYPKLIKLTWLKDGKPVTSDVTSTEEMADGDWYYQIHSHLEYIPKSGEKISCMVEHSSFSKPMVYDWDPSPPESERNKSVIGISGLVLGITLAAAGLIYCKRKSCRKPEVRSNLPLSEPY